MRDLAENGVPMTVFGVTVYQDRAGRRFVDVGADHEPDINQNASGGGQARPKRFKVDGRLIVVSDLLNADDRTRYPLDVDSPKSRRNIQCACFAAPVTSASTTAKPIRRPRGQLKRQLALTPTLADTHGRYRTDEPWQTSV